MGRYAVGLDIGGTRIKMGIIELESGKVMAAEVFPTERHFEVVFYESIRKSLCHMLSKLSMDAVKLVGIGISIGSYVYSDGTLNGLIGIVDFMPYGYPLKKKLEEALNLNAKIDNDARLIGQAEALYGAGRGFSRVLTLTFGTGIGVGLCIDGQLTDKEATIHLAGHIRVRDEHDCKWLDEPPCYCGLTGCFESTCSGSALEKQIHHMLGKDISNQKMFQLAEQESQTAVNCVRWYIEMLCRGLNQYVYIYCPDVIVLGGGVSNSFAPWLVDIQENIIAKVNERQKTAIRLSELKEHSGILGSAALFM
ncbi:MAG: ROK family protein [Herbinix sp.]|nr:ROK family protein [Herbinix sp.]